MKLNLSKSLLVGVALSIAHVAHATEISAATSKSQALMGYAYDTNKQAFIGEGCLEPQNSGAQSPQAGAQQSGFNFSQSISQSQLASELGFGLEGRASYGVYKASLGANYYQQSVSNSFSISSTWESQYVFPNQLMGPYKYSSVGEAVKNNNERWITTCGNEVVTQIVKGAKLFFSIRVDFKSEAAKKSFSEHFDLSGPAAGVNQTLQQASQEFAQKATVTITAHQVGGVVDQVTKLFGAGANSAVAPFVQCQLGHFEQCALLLQKFLTYATDTAGGFPSQVAAHPAVLSYLTVPYEAIGIYRKDYPILRNEILLGRMHLNDQFNEQFNAALAARRLLKAKTEQHDLIQIESEKLDKNILELGRVADVCYETPQKCLSEIAGVKLLPIEFELLRTPTFVYLCKLSLRPNQTDLRTFMSVFAASANAVAPSNEASCGALDQKAHSLTEITIDGSTGNFSLPDLTPLVTLDNLQKLAIMHAHIDDIIQLSALLNLQALDLRDNRISDLTPLSSLTELKFLNLARNDISELTGLDRLHRIRVLDLRGNQISKLNEILKFKEMYWLNVSANPVVGDSAQMQALVDALPTSVQISK